MRAELEADGNEVWLSPISVWEALILVDRGRIQVTTQADVWVTQMVRAIPRREAPLTHEVAIESRRVRLPHQDPADRFLVASALVFDLTLVTADERLLESNACAVLANG